MLLLAIYTVLGAVPTLLSLNCPHHHTHSHHSEASCCCCHTPIEPCEEHDAHYEKACSCNHDHSTELRLYTLPSDGEQSRQQLRVVADDLPDALAVEENTFKIENFSYERLLLGVEWGSDPDYPHLFALRAPPVWA